MREDLLFWVAVLIYVAEVPIICWLPMDFKVWGILIDFLVGTAFLCIWIERRERKIAEPPLLVFIREED